MTYVLPFLHKMLVRLSPCWKRKCQSVAVVSKVNLSKTLYRIKNSVFAKEDKKYFVKR